MGYSKVVKALKASAESSETPLGVLKATILKNDNGFYSKRIIKQKALDIVKVLENPDAKTIEMFGAFFALYEAFYAAPHRKIGYHPSSLSEECPRKMYYEVSGEKGTPKKQTLTAENQLTFDIGTLLHSYIQYKFWKAGILDDCEVEIESPEGIIGKGDGVIVFKGKRILLEIKTINDYGFQKLVSPIKKHEEQASLYADELGIDQILYLYINKDKSTFKDYLLAPVKKYIDQQKKKCIDVNLAIDEKEAPDRVCLNVISERALKCPFADICFES